MGVLALAPIKKICIYLISLLFTIVIMMIIHLIHDSNVKTWKSKKVHQQPKLWYLTYSFCSLRTVLMLLDSVKLHHTTLAISFLFRGAYLVQLFSFIVAHIIMHWDSVCTTTWGGNPLPLRNYVQNLTVKSGISQVLSHPGDWNISWGVDPTWHCHGAGCRFCERSFLGASGNPLSSP